MVFTEEQILRFFLDDNDEIDTVEMGDPAAKVIVEPTLKLAIEAPSSKVKNLKPAKTSKKPNPKRGVASPLEKSSESSWKRRKLLSSEDPTKDLLSYEGAATAIAEETLKRSPQGCPSFYSQSCSCSYLTRGTYQPSSTSLQRFSET
ncbi:hypothetical protein NE237_019129 [Protea cynaroides]|uniref:Uncharacterized protein n=1 Tax=Protea cynaroides TaxID=273540 RepID=A0A9Q0KBA5_9MAGN|nr:hypothetical protein NE237_019129 [Protea cynaroides]